jgi:membrane protease subunit HflK
MVRLGRDRLRQIVPSQGPGGVIGQAVLALAGLAAWTAVYTVPSESLAVVQCFGRYLARAT